MKKIILLLFQTVLLLHGQEKKTFLFVGTYTDSKPDKGIYVFAFDNQTGALNRVATGTDITNPSFLTLSPNGQFLYACTDTKTLLPGSLSSFAIDSLTGAIRFINKESSIGANPVYAAVDKTGHYVVAANYTGGSVTVFTTNEDGGIKPAVQHIQFTDSSINKSRQDKSHIHSSIFSPGFDFLYLPDLGADKIRVFSFSTNASSPLAPFEEATVKTTAGHGPRHMVFHPFKKTAYCIEEMSGTVAVYNYNKGRLALMQNIGSCQQTADEHSSADIHISPDGLFLYASNRGENTIAIYAIGKDGRLTLKGHQPSIGDTPRNFCIDPSGQFLLVANQSSNNIVVFKRDLQTGALSNTSLQVTVPAPSCLQMKTYSR